MIISTDKKPTLHDFSELMSRTDVFLNKEAVSRGSYYLKRNGTQLEEDVFRAMLRTSENTPFKDTIKLVSGARFPDITAAGYYGVEVKSTSKNHWKSIGSSILESTRIEGIERIYLTFGKLSDPVQFRSRPYEECLSGIYVTHYPRYQIDMDLRHGETIFDKIHIPYDSFRKMENQIAPISDYYKSQLKPGESLWWANSDLDQQAAPPTLRLWIALSPQQKRFYTCMGYALFPEILSQKGTEKYQRLALWLVASHGIVNTNIRDQFSAGGKGTIVVKGRTYKDIPAVFVRIMENRLSIRNIIQETDENELLSCWKTAIISQDRINQWIDIAVGYSGGKEQYREMLDGLLCNV